MTTNVLAPTPLTGECEGAFFEITLIGHITDKPYKVTYYGPGGAQHETWHSDLAVAARAAIKWLMKYHPYG